MTETSLAFASLPLSPEQLAVLQQLEYFEMTPIQAAALPLALAGHDLIAQAKTGSGKTATFGLPLLARLNPRLSGKSPGRPKTFLAPSGGGSTPKGQAGGSPIAVQAMVLCPTRELAEQVAQEIRRLARAQDNIKVLTLCGGSPARAQVTSLEHGAHIVVGTPGRLMDHIERGSLKLEALSTLVLDEADRMLDMGFFDDIAWVASHCPPGRQTLLFSATYPEGIAKLATQFLRQPREVKLTEAHEPEKIRQRFYEIEPEERLAAVGQLLRHYRPTSTLAFCNTRQQCRDLFNQLRHEGFHVLTLHGELEQHERDQVLIRFANRSCSVLVATDVAARGLDIDQLEAVINVDITPDPEVHVHRVGRTGRADQNGWALSLVGPADRRKIAAIAQLSGITPEWHKLSSLVPASEEPLLPPMSTLQILGGKKDKIRPGDVLGALTGEAGFTREQVGKIQVTEQSTYVAVSREIAGEAVRRLGAGRIKGKTVKLRRL